MPYDPETNTGHGHVWERPDGVRMRCGGPRLCAACKQDLVDKVQTIGLVPAIKRAESPYDVRLRQQTQNIVNEWSAQRLTAFEAMLKIRDALITTRPHPSAR